MKEEFIKKMIAAKKLEYQAFKEIMPDGVKAHVDLLEEQMADAMKDIAYTYFFSGTTGACRREDASQSNTTRKNGMNETGTKSANDFDECLKESLEKNNKTHPNKKEKQGRTKKIQVD